MSEFAGLSAIAKALNNVAEAVVVAEVVKHCSRAQGDSGVQSDRLAHAVATVLEDLRAKGVCR